MIPITYRFHWEDDREWTYAVHFPEPGEAVADAALPEGAPWAALDFHQCPFCPLRADRSPACPAAVALARLLENCHGLDSYEAVNLEVITRERTVSRRTTVQQGLAALFGLVIGTSGCPKTAFFRPMAHFHLPLASPRETLYRAASSYLLAQYFRQLKGETPDWELKGLVRHYADMQVLNRHLAFRLRDATQTDAAVNAIILLDVLAKGFPPDIHEELTAEFGPLFEEFLAAE